jgi:excinuclease UvrABC nuclease subunit
MNRCLRPCQQAVTRDEYRTEAHRMRDFLATRGAALLEPTAAARDRFSRELLFEEAARQHARYEKIEQVARGAGELAREVTHLHGVAVTASREPESVILWFLREGCWLKRRAFSVAPAGDKPVSLDTRLREIVASLEQPHPHPGERQDHLALLAKWFYSSWRDGEWLAVESWEALPYRKLVNAIHRVVVGGPKGSRPQPPADRS